MVGENVEIGLYPISKALEIAKSLETDLVEISPKASPPVCKALDYKKFLYDQRKREKFLKAKTQKVIVKEIRFGPQTDQHDYEFKKKHAIKFLQEGAKLKAFVFFKGRSIIFKEQGQILLLKLAQELGSNIESGQISINHHGLGLVENPFGGVKGSGVGSEMGAEGIEPYLNVKFISQVGL